MDLVSKSQRDKGLRDPCIEHKQGGRYARVRRNGHLVAQHVAVWEDANGPKPDGWQVDHLCFNTRCIRLDHLEAVPAIENARRNRNTRFDLATIRQIRSEYAALPRARVRTRKGVRLALAQKYNIGPRYLHAIVTRRVWPDGQS